MWIYNLISKNIRTTDEENEWAVWYVQIWVVVIDIVLKKGTHTMVNLRPKYWLNHPAMTPPLYDILVKYRNVED